MAKNTWQDFKALSSVTQNPAAGFIRFFIKSTGIIARDSSGNEDSYLPLSADGTTIQNIGNVLSVLDIPTSVKNSIVASVSLALDDLSDVTEGSPSEDDILTYGGSAGWSSQDAATWMSSILTKAMVEGVLTGQISTHSHSEQLAADNGIQTAASTLWVDDEGRLVVFNYDETNATNDPPNTVSLLLHGQNDATDRSDGGLTVTNNNVTYNSTDKNIGDYCFEFNGTDANLTVGDDATLSPSGSFLLAGFFRFDSVTGTRTLFSKESADTSAKEYRLEFDPVNGLVFKWATNAGDWDYEISKLWSPSVDTWYWIAFAYDGSAYHVIVDDTVLETATQAISIYNGANDLLIGESPVVGSENRFDGQMQEIVICKGLYTFIQNVTTPVTPTTMFYVTQEYDVTNSKFDELVDLTKLNLADATELTISGGSVTITQVYHTVDGEGDADDDLATISGGVEGDLLFLRPENAARNITLKHGTGNIVTSNGSDYVIPDNAYVIMLHDGSNWRLVGGGGSSIYTASRALQSDASGFAEVSSVTSTELGYVSGVTSGIQAQFGGKAASGANSDITSLSGLTTPLSIAQGGTAGATQQAALDNVTDAGSAVNGQVLTSDGTNASFEDLPTTSFQDSFTDADLSSGELTVTHNLSQQRGLAVIVSDENDNVIIPDEITFDSSSQLTVDLTSFGTISGTWNIGVTKAGGSGTGSEFENNDQTGTTYTLVLADRGKTVWMNNGSANTLTIPTNAAVSFEIGTTINVVQEGAGVTTVEGDAGVTLNGVSGGSGDLVQQYSGVSMTKRATDAWIVIGAHGGVS